MSPKTLRYVLAWSLAFNVGQFVRFEQLKSATVRLMFASDRLMDVTKKCDGLLDRWEKVGASCEGALTSAQELPSPP